MQQTSVTSKGQVTIPQEIRQQFGIHKGSKISFHVVEGHIELRVAASPVKVPENESGFGMLKAKRKAVPADFDPATLLKP